MEPKRPQGRKKIVSGTTSGVHRRGSGLNTGPVGGGFGGNPGGTSPVRPSSSTPTRGARKGGISPILLILLALLVFGGGGGGLLSGLLGGGSSQTVTPAPSVSPSPSLPSAIPSALSTLLGGAAETWSSDANTAKLDTTVASSARAKRTVIYGDGRWLYSNHATDPAGGHLCNASTWCGCISSATSTPTRTPASS